MMCCSLWGHKESDTTERLNWTEQIVPKNLWGNFPGGPVVKISCWQCRRYGFHCWSGSRIPHTLLHGRKQKKQTNKLWLKGLQTEDPLGRKLVFLFFAIPRGLWDLNSLIRNWTQATGVKPRNPNYCATSCWGFFVPLHLYTKPFLNSQEDLILLLSSGVYDTAFTQILVVNVYPLGIHVALSGWVVQAYLNGWSRRKVHKIIKGWAVWACDLFLYSLSPSIPVLNHCSRKFWNKWLWNRGNQDLVLKGPRAPNTPSPTPQDNLIISGLWIYPWLGLRHNYT